VTDDGGVVARSAGKCTTVTNLLLNVADNGTFGELTNGENVANSESCFLATIDESTSVETFSSDESLAAKLVAVRVAENDSGKGSTTINSKLSIF